MRADYFLPDHPSGPQRELGEKRNFISLVTAFLAAGRVHIFQPGTKQVRFTIVTSPRGRKYKIFDLYGALGFIVSEVELKEYRVKFSALFHRRILATFSKWILITSFQMWGKPRPNTTCIVYENQIATNLVDPFLYTSALSCTQATLPSYSRRQRGLLRFLGYENLLSLHPRSTVETAAAFGLSPAWMTGSPCRLGHCCEIAALCRLLHAILPGRTVFFFGIALRVTPRSGNVNLEHMANYDANALGSILMPPCPNCQQVFQTLNIVLSTDPRYDGIPDAGFRYRDVSTPGAPLDETLHPTRTNRKCPNSVTSSASWSIFDCMGKFAFDSESAQSPVAVLCVGTCCKAETSESGARAALAEDIVHGIALKNIAETTRHITIGTINHRKSS
uniref:Uncharacterized protein n=1 Tax=Mycena chlorophos TaxID=658473 RepID=A0ABQ0M3A7_MYCCL|nr:predicted protein [Mycena chlorophos]